MNRKIIFFLLTLLVGITTIGLTCAAEPTNSTGHVNTTDGNTPTLESNSDCNGSIDYPILHNDKDCNGSLDVNGNPHKISTDDVLPAPIQTNKTIELNDTNIKNKQVFIDTPITTNTPVGHIKNPGDLQTALIWGGNWVIDNDLRLNDTNPIKYYDYTTNIDGQHHTIYSADKWNTHSDIKLTSGTINFTYTIFNNVRLDASNTNLTLYGCAFTHERTGLMEWANSIFAENSNLYLEYVRFFDDESNQGFRGACLIANSVATFKKCTFENVSANDGMGCKGGCICSDGSRLSVEDCEFTNCRADDDGGCIYLENGAATITGSKFVNCRTYKTPWYRVSSKGSCIYAAGDITAVGNQFLDCTADGSKDYQYDGVIDFQNKDITINVHDNYIHGCKIGY